MNKKLPNCILIGAMKAGTTSLHNYLSIHPQVFGSEVKEIDFFVEELNWKKGIEWYQKQFESEAKIKFESSQNYTKRHVYKKVPERIQKVLGDEVKFIYLVRDPIKRIKSHFIERLSAGINQLETIDMELKKFSEDRNLADNHYVRTSMYGYQIQAYYALFPSRNILIVHSHDLANERMKTLNRIFDFLGLDKIESDEQFNFKSNTGATKSYIPKRTIRIIKFICRLPILNLLNLDSLLRGVFSNKIEKYRNELSDEIESGLTGLFLEDRKLLDQLADEK